MQFNKFIKNFGYLEKILLVVALYLIIICVSHIFSTANLSLNSDAASFITLATENIRTGQILPDNWYGSTGFVLLNYIIAAILLLVPDYLLAKDIAQFLILFLLIVTTVLFTKVVFHNNSWIISIIVLFTYISNTQYDMLYTSCYYTFTFIFIFTSLIFIYKGLDFTQNFIKSKKYIFLSALCCVFFSCVGGILFVQQFVLPFIGAIIIWYLICNYNKKISEVKDFKKQIILTLLLLSITMIGLMGSNFLNNRLHITGNNGLLFFNYNLVDNIPLFLQGLVDLFGFTSGAFLFSIAGINNLLRLVFVVGCVFVIPFFAWKRIKNFTSEVAVFYLFVFLHVLEVVIILICSTVDVISIRRYFLSSFILLCILSCNYIYEEFIQRKNLIGILVSVVIFCFAILSSFPMILNFENYNKRLDSMKGLADFLVENDLHYGYASYWNAGNNTVLSNGQVQINAILPYQDNIKKYLWLSSDDWYSPDFYSGKTFLMLTDEEMNNWAPEGCEKTKLGRPSEIIEYNQYKILVYKYNISLGDFDGRFSAYYNWNFSMNLSDESMLKEDGCVIIKPGQVMYGPYIDLESGKYVLTVNMESSESNNLTLTANAGATLLDQFEIKNGDNSFVIDFEEDMKQVEFVVYASNKDFKIDSIFLESI